MSIGSYRVAAPVAAIVSCCLAGLLVLAAAPSQSNVVPESALLMHVQPVSGTCETPLTACHDITISTHADGQLEFLMFFMRGTLFPGEPVVLWSIETTVYWPDSWQLVDFDPCWGYGSLDPEGETHALELAWSGGYQVSDEDSGIIPVARLVMDVSGEGWLHPGFGTAQVWHDGTPYISYPAWTGAAAGLQCGHYQPRCAYGEFSCMPHFHVDELILNAVAGSIADTTISFNYHPPVGCYWSVDTHAPWCDAWAWSPPDDSDGHLRVEADATGLAPGIYETAIEVYFGWGSHCLPIVFMVELGPVATETRSWSHIKRMYR
jgi:hypothetical protein